MSEKKLVYEKVEELREEAIKLFQDIIKIKTINYGPAFDQGDEKELGDFVSDYMRGLGMEVQQIEPYPKRVSCVGRLKGKIGKPTLAFYAHMDVVPIDKLEQWRYPPFAGEIHKGMIYGRGASDMKQGIAGSLFAVKALKECGIELNGDVLLAYGAGEETSFPHGLEELVKKGLLKADFCIQPHGGITIEPHKPFMIILGHRGNVTFKITAKGVKGHVGRKEQAVNAIIKICEVAKAIDTMRFTKTDPHPVVPAGADVSVNILKGGFKENVIPDEAYIICDCRYGPGLTKEIILDDVNKVLDELKEKDKLLNLEVELLDYALPSWTFPTDPIVEETKKVFKEFDPGKEINAFGGKHTSDSRHIRLAGIPVSTSLAASGSGGHGPNEYNYIESYITSIKMMASIIINILK